MAYLALARKYRPQTYDEVVGQDVACKTLKNSLELKKLHHAYLFTGPRGIGKTTLARLFAKSLNCKKGPSSTPCNTCSPCVEITSGKSLDVLEIDGASNTSVDDVRQLRDGIQYMAAGGKHKIYIIDEVHMLSNAAFNALLKTLEEPPAHVIFIFATTEAQKLPLTILSRILRFDFRRLQSGEIYKQLESICQKENIKAEAGALLSISREATGSMRDGLSLLDQAIASGGDTITTAFVEKLLGMTSQAKVSTLLEAILKKEAKQSIEILHSIFEAGEDLRRLALTLTQNFHDLLLFKTTNDFSILSEKSDDEKKTIETLAKLGETLDFERLFELSMHSYQDLQRTPLPKAHFEVALVRMSRSIPVQSLDEILNKLDGMESEITPRKPAEKIAARPIPIQKKSPPPVVKTNAATNWPGFLAYINKTKPQVGSIVSSGSLITFLLPKIELGFPKGSIYGDVLQEPEKMNQLTTLAGEYFKREVEFSLSEANDATAKNTDQAWGNDQVIADTMSVFPGSSAKVIPGKETT